MTTNGTNNIEDADMAECDGEKVVTMMDVLQEQQDFEDDANAVLGASDEKNCTYSKGYIKRQAIYACLTCCTEAKDDPTKRAGVCLACSLNCHENHELIELYTKRNFRCDCGNPKFNSHPCQFTPDKTDLNEDNKYNQNFVGIYCNCHRPYPDPESNVEDEEMIQCIICEDWLHASHLDAAVPGSDQYSEMICHECMDKNEFLYDYSNLAVNFEMGEVDIIAVNGSDVKMTNGDLNTDKILNVTSETSENTENNQKMDVNTEEQEDQIIQNKSLAENRDTTATLEQEQTIEPVEANNDILEVKKTEEPSQIFNDLNDDSKADEKISEELSEDQPEPQDLKETTIETTEEAKIPVSVSEINQNGDTIAAAEPSQISNDLNDDSKADEKISEELSEDQPEPQDLKETAIETTEEAKIPVSESEINQNGDTIAAADNSETKMLSNNSHDTTENIEDSETKSEAAEIALENKENDLTKVDCEEINSKNENIDQIADNNVNESINTDTANLEIDNKLNVCKEIGETTNVNLEENENSLNKTEKLLDEVPSKVEINDKADNIEVNSSETHNLLNETTPIPDEDNNSTSIETDTPSSETKSDPEINNSKTNMECEETSKDVSTDEPSMKTDEIASQQVNNAQENKNKRKLSTEEAIDDSLVKKSKLNEETGCIRSKGIKRVHKGAMFWPSHFRQKLCTCSVCLSMYKDLSVLFLIDPEDTVFAYEALGKERVDGRPTQYEKGLEALSSLDRIQQINALTEYNKMKDKLLDFLKNFKDRKEVVKEEDIKAFFAGMKPKREPDGVYFCR